MSDSRPGTNLQIIIFAIISVLSLIGLRRIIQKKFFYSKGMKSEEVEDEFTGKEAIAISDFGADVDRESGVQRNNLES